MLHIWNTHMIYGFTRVDSRTRRTAYVKNTSQKYIQIDIRSIRLCYYWLYNQRCLKNTTTYRCPMRKEFFTDLVKCFTVRSQTTHELFLKGKKRKKKEKKLKTIKLSKPIHQIYNTTYIHYIEFAILVLYKNHHVYHNNFLRWITCDKSCCWKEIWKMIKTKYKITIISK